MKLHVKDFGHCGSVIYEARVVRRGYRVEPPCWLYYIWISVTHLLPAQATREFIFWTLISFGKNSPSLQVTVLQRATLHNTSLWICLFQTVVNHWPSKPPSLMAEWCLDLQEAELHLWEINFLAVGQQWRHLCLQRTWVKLVKRVSNNNPQIKIITMIWHRAVPVLKSPVTPACFSLNMA